MFPLIKTAWVILRIDLKTGQNLLGPVSLELDPKTKANINRFLPQTKILIIKIKEFITIFRIREMEVKVSSYGEKQGQGVGGSEEFDGVAEEKYDW